METLLLDSKIKSEKQKTKNKKTIPKELVYEIIDGKNIYYAGYKDVLNKNKTIEDIMGCSGLQSYIIQAIVKSFNSIEFQGNTSYQLLYSELGLHLSLKNNLAADIAIYNKKEITYSDLEDKYMQKPPRVIFEIDTKADINNFDDVLEYIEIKTKKLIDFGAEQIIWILTKSKKIITIKDSKKWNFANWNEEINVIDDINITIEKLINK